MSDRATTNLADPSDEAVLNAFPSAAITHDNIEHYRARLAHRLLINRCGDCSHWYEPPSAVCPKCWSHNVEPTAVSGRGTVHLFTVLHVGAQVPDVDYKEGYPVAAIELVEQVGLRFTAGIVECAQEELEIGLPVEITWVDRGGETTPMFRPVGKHS